MDQASAAGELTDDDIHSLIRDADWKRGSMFRASNVQLYAHTYVEPLKDRLLVAPQPTPDYGLWVVVSQTCDIVAPLEVEPVIEAFPCYIEADRAIRANLRRSYRAFEIDPESGLVAKSVLRLSVSKRAVVQINPEPWPGTPERLARFSKWLGLRTSRDAIPDEIDRPFLGPLRKIMGRLRESRARYLAFNAAVKEIRIHPPDTEEPPFAIPVVIIIEQELSAETAAAIDDVINRWKNEVVPTGFSIVGPRILTTDRISLDETDRTWLVDLISDSYDGGRLIGAAPVHI